MSGNSFGTRLRYSYWTWYGASGIDSEVGIDIDIYNDEDTGDDGDDGDDGDNLMMIAVAFVWLRSSMMSIHRIPIEAQLISLEGPVEIGDPNTYGFPCPNPSNFGCLGVPPQKYIKGGLWGCGIHHHHLPLLHFHHNLHHTKFHLTLLHFSSHKFMSSHLFSCSIIIIIFV